MDQALYRAESSKIHGETWRKARAPRTQKFPLQSQIPNPEMSTGFTQPDVQQAAELRKRTSPLLPQEKEKKRKVKKMAIARSEAEKSNHRDPSS